MPYQNGPSGLKISATLLKCHTPQDTCFLKALHLVNFTIFVHGLQIHILGFLKNVQCPTFIQCHMFLLFDEFPLPYVYGRLLRVFFHRYLHEQKNSLKVCKVLGNFNILCTFEQQIMCTNMSYILPKLLIICIYDNAKEQKMHFFFNCPGDNFVPFVALPIWSHYQIFSISIDFSTPFRMRHTIYSQSICQRLISCMYINF